MPNISSGGKEEKNRIWAGNTFGLAEKGNVHKRVEIMMKERQSKNPPKWK